LKSELRMSIPVILITLDLNLAHWESNQLINTRSLPFCALAFKGAIRL